MLGIFREYLKEIHFIRTIKNSGLFDKEYYIKNNLDVAKSCVEPLKHYVRYGWKEGRNPSLGFNTSFYLNAYQDVKEQGCNPLLHYVLYGEEEGRSPCFANNESLQKDVSYANKIISKQDKMFSVIMPTWNRKEVICRAIDSVLKQSYQHYELIISDDGSTDGTQKIIEKKYSKELKSGRILYLYNKHLGVSAARNAALSKARGDWIAYLDSDNRWRKHYLLMTAFAFVKNPKHKTLYSQILVCDSIKSVSFIRGREFDYEQLKQGNFIDLNIYSHHKDVYSKYGGFDEALTRLVDWDMILRHVQKYPPYYLKYVLADYFLKDDLNNITSNIPLEENYIKIRAKIEDAFQKNKYELNNVVRIGYVLHDFPNKSQTFIFAEIRQFIEMGYDIKVYYSMEPEYRVELDFVVDSYMVKDNIELAKLLREHDRQFCHCHFVYPSVTNFMYPASRLTGIPYSFMPHAIDIFHKENVLRNNLDEITNYDGCKGIVVHGKYHEEILCSQNVPKRKIIYNAQAFEVNNVNSPSEHFYYDAKCNPLKIVTITRFLPKKGLDFLIQAVSAFSPQEIQLSIYGFGREEKYLKSIVEDQQINNVYFKGSIESVDQREEVLRNSHLFALTCIEDENGDKDGVPTVFFEAYSAGIPVLTTRISTIPDYIVDGINGILVEPKSIAAITDALKKILERPRAWLAQLVDNSQSELMSRVGTQTTITAIKTFFTSVLDIIIVVTQDISINKVSLLYEQIKQCTMTNYHLYIVVNGCDCNKQKEIDNLIEGDINVTLLFEREKVGCGVALNKALSAGKGEYVVYLCVNEAFIVKQGWERNILNCIVNHPNAAMGGTLISSPNWVTGEDYMKQSWFDGFRNKDYAKLNLSHNFKHVQGGVFILRRSFYDRHGGFKLPHNYMDVEYSYYAESLGYELIEIPSIVSLTKATRPLVYTYFDENTAIVHPLQNTFERDLLNKLVESKSCYCNISATIELTNQDYDFEGIIHKSTSSPFSRAVYKVLGLSSYIYRNLKLLAISPEMLLKETISKNKMFDIKYYECSKDSIDKIKLYKILQKYPETECLILYNLQHDVFDMDVFPLLVSRMLPCCKYIIFSVGCDEYARHIEPKSISKTAKKYGYDSKKINLTSKVLKLGFLSLYQWTVSDVPVLNTRCNICGFSEFKSGPYGRSSLTKMLPECMGCHSLERHRAVRIYWETKLLKYLDNKSVLQFSNDRSVCSDWFKQHELSIYGKQNSIDVQNIDRPDESYDIVICNHVLEHIPDDSKAISEFLRIIKPEGFICLTFPAPLQYDHTQDWGYPDEKQHGHYRIYGLQDIRKVLDDIVGTDKYTIDMACDPVTGDAELLFFLKSNLVK